MVVWVPWPQILLALVLLVLGLRRGRVSRPVRRYPPAPDDRFNAVWDDWDGTSSED